MQQDCRVTEVYLVYVANLAHLVKSVLQVVKATQDCPVLKDLQEKAASVDHQVNLARLDHKDH